MNTLGPNKSWRLVHDGQAVLLLDELAGITETTHQTFEAQTLRECVSEVLRLGLPVPQEYADSVPTTPTTITMRQARLVLNAAGLLDDVEAAVAAADRATQIEWEYASTLDRNWPTLLALSTALGLHDTEVDALFTQAAQL